MQNSITFLDQSGDTTIVWDSDTEEKILKLIEAKMAQGYVFYLVKKVPLLNVSRRIATKSMKQIKEAGSVILKDAELERLFLGGDIGTTSRPSTMIDTVKKASNANEVVVSQSVAVRPTRGG